MWGGGKIFISQNGSCYTHVYFFVSSLYQGLIPALSSPNFFPPARAHLHNISVLKWLTKPGVYDKKRKK